MREHGESVATDVRGLVPEARVHARGPRLERVWETEGQIARAHDQVRTDDGLRTLFQHGEKDLEKHKHKLKLFS